jgi:hypothetical protein
MLVFSHSDYSIYMEYLISARIYTPDFKYSLVFMLGIKSVASDRSEKESECDCDLKLTSGRWFHPWN